jgi:hypothetical protein
MSSKQLDRASQGIISGKKIFGAVGAMPVKSGKAAIARAGRDVSAEDNRRTKPRPPQEEGGKVDFRRG